MINLQKNFLGLPISHLVFNIKIACSSCDIICLFSSGMKWPSFSGQECLWRSTGSTSGFTWAASPHQQLWTGCMNCWRTTAILDLRSPVTRQSSCWKSFWRTMLLRMWRVDGAWKTWRTTASCTGRYDKVDILKLFERFLVKNVMFYWFKTCFRFPSTSPLKPIPNRAPILRKKSISMMDRESFFKFRSSKKFDKEVLVSFVAPNVVLMWNFF